LSFLIFQISNLKVRISDLVLSALFASSAFSKCSLFVIVGHPKVPGLGLRLVVEFEIEVVGRPRVAVVPFIGLPVAVVTRRIVEVGKRTGFVVRATPGLCWMTAGACRSNEGTCHGLWSSVVEPKAGKEDDGWVNRPLVICTYVHYNQA
jgi:hypothetical protein